MFIIFFGYTHFWYVKTSNEGLFLTNFGKRVRFLRKKRGFSQEDLANDCDIPINQIGRIERAEINTTLKTFHKILVALDIEPIEFFSEGFD